MPTVKEIAHDIRWSATSRATDDYLSADSDFIHNILDGVNLIGAEECMVKSLNDLGITDEFHQEILEDLDALTNPEVRETDRGTGNFNEDSVAYWVFIGEQIDEPEWEYDLDSPEWKAAVAIVQDEQLALLGEQLFGIAEDGEVHYDFDNCACLVWDKQELAHRGYLLPPEAESATIDRSMIGTITLFDENGDTLYTVYEQQHAIGFVCLTLRIEEEWHGYGDTSYFRYGEVGSVWNPDTMGWEAE